MATMKEVCDIIGVSYETLRFYCNEGLVPNVKRDKNNHRVFDKKDIEWLLSLMCLKECGMGITGMKAYMQLCMEGKSSIPERKQILDKQKKIMLQKIAEINKCIDFIENKQEYFDGVLAGIIEYSSNLIDVGERGYADVRTTATG